MMIHNVSRKELETAALTIRRDIIEMVFSAKSGHIGGSLSIADMMAVLYWAVMNVDPQNPDSADRDRFVLSKGHTAPALYAALAEKGFFPRERLFDQYRRMNSMLQGHPDMKKTPGIDMSSGSLGLGLSTAVGMALGAQRKNRGFNVFSIVGDGETNEGGIWEAAASAAFYHLDNLYAFIDLNGMQNDGFTSQVMDMGDMSAKWKAFGWYVQEADGHDVMDIYEKTRHAMEVSGMPKVIICRTVKGKGVSFMENSIRFHGGQPSQEEYALALKELGVNMGTAQ